MVGLLLLIALAPFAVAAEEPKPSGILGQLIEPLRPFQNQLQNAAQQLLPPIASLLPAGQFLNPVRTGRGIDYNERTEPSALIIPLPHNRPYFLARPGPYPQGYAVVPLPNEPAFVYTFPKVHHPYNPYPEENRAQVERSNIPEKTSTVGEIVSKSETHSVTRQPVKATVAEAGEQ